MIRELTWELACGKPPVEGMKLDQVMVFYHNDQEEGFGVGLRARKDLESGLEIGLHAAFDAYKRDWDQSDEQRRQEILGHYAGQVEHAARHRGTHNYPEIILIMNVIWLIHYAGMSEDEFNGLQFMWVNEPARNVLWAAQ